MAPDPPLDVKVEESACQSSTPVAEEQGLHQPSPQVSPRDAQPVWLEEQMEKAHGSDVEVAKALAAAASTSFAVAPPPVIDSDDHDAARI